MKGYNNQPKYYCLTTGCNEETHEGMHYCFYCELKHSREMVKRRKESINIDDEGRNKGLYKNAKKYKKYEKFNREFKTKRSGF